MLGAQPIDENLTCFDEGRTPRHGIASMAQGIAQPRERFADAWVTRDEVAAALGSSPRSVNRLWTAAPTWLQRELASAAPAE